MTPPSDATELRLAPLMALENTLRQDIAQGHLPGAVCTLVRYGQPVWSTQLGKLSPVHDQAMPIDAIFRIYSMTKPVVSAAILRLIEQGHLSLDQAVAQWLPAFAHMHVATPDGGLEPAQRPITIEDLLCHTAGLAYDFTGHTPVHRQYANARLFNRRRPSAEFIHTLAQLPLLDHPGRSWSYSHATDVLGCLLEVLSGQTLDVYLKQHIFDPLDMPDTGFHVPEKNHHRIAQPLAHDPDTGRPVLLFDVRKPPAHAMGGAGLVSTAPDYSRFLQALLSGDFLSNTTRQHLLTDQLQGRPITGAFLPQGEGFGWAMAIGQSVNPVGMGYWEGLAGTSFLIDPTQGVHAQLLIQQPGRRAHYAQLLRLAVAQATRA